MLILISVFCKCMVRLEMRFYRPDSEFATSFDERYSHVTERPYHTLIKMFNSPCTPFEKIGHYFDVTYKAVSKWYVEVNPSDSGEQRRKECGRLRRRARLFRNQLFSFFYRKAREYFSRDDIELIQSGTGFASGSVRIHEKTVLVRKATRLLNLEIKFQCPVYRLLSPGEDGDFVFYKAGSSYLFVPRDHLPVSTGGTFLDRPKEHYETSPYSNKYLGFKDKFDAFYPDTV